MDDAGTVEERPFSRGVKGGPAYRRSTLGDRGYLV